MAVAADRKSPDESAANPIELLSDLVADDMRAVNAVILKRMESPVALIPQLAGHIIAAGGKRLRPMLTLATARMCGYDGDARHVNLAACVEFIHTATLLHDDVVDESDLRRGIETANSLWGNKASVLVGDFLFSRAFQLMVADGSLEVLRILSDASAVIAEGEVGQLMTANDTETDEAAYLEVIQAKTAALFAAACRVGAVVAERPEAEAEALDSYGMNLGIAFQLVDDVLDFAGGNDKFGKAAGDDFREGKMTLPIVLAYARGSEEERRFWRRCIEDLEQRDGDLERAIGLLDKHRAIEDSLNRARRYGTAAKEALMPFPRGEIRGALDQIVDFVIDRAY